MGQIFLITQAYSMEILPITSKNPHSKVSTRRPSLRAEAPLASLFTPLKGRGFWVRILSYSNMTSLLSRFFPLMRGQAYWKKRTATMKAINPMLIPRVKKGVIEPFPAIRALRN